MGKLISDLQPSSNIQNSDKLVLDQGDKTTQLSISQLKDIINVEEGIPTINDLRQITSVEDGDIYNVLGYYSIGDGGGGTFYWDPSSIETDNGGTIIQITGVGLGRWKRVYDSEPSVKWFGAKEDDDTAGVINNAAFISAFQAINEPLIVNDTFYITPTTQATIDSNIIIRGGGTIIFNSTTLDTDTGSYSAWIALTSNIDEINISDLNIKTTLTGENAFVNMIRLDSTAVIDSFTLAECNINGVSPLRGTLDLADGTNFYGIKYLNVRNNRVDMTNNPLSFIKMTNMQHDNIYITDNTFTNISYVGLTFSIDESRNVGQYNSIIAKGNRVVNDDTFYHIGEATYHAFLLYEGVKMIYCNNHVEGLKSTEIIALYDVYINTDFLNYHDNTFKNNMCFNDNKNNADILKSKGTLETYYKNNVFIVEEDFVTSNNGTVDNAWSRVGCIKTSGNDDSKLVIEGNKFDIFANVGQLSSTKTLDVIIRNNDFILKHTASNFLTINNTNENVTTYEDAIIDISNNKFIIEDASTNINYNTQDNNSFYLLKMVYDGDNGKGKYKNITIKDNFIDIGVANNAKIFNGGLAAKTLDVIGNTFILKTGEDEDSFKPLYNAVSSDIEGITIRDNIFRYEDSTGINSIATNSFNLGFNGIPAVTSNGGNHINFIYHGPYRDGMFFKILKPDASVQSGAKVKVSFKQDGKVYSGQHSIEFTDTTLTYTDTSSTSQTKTQNTTDQFINDILNHKVDPADDLIPSDSNGLKIRYASDDESEYIRLQFGCSTLNVNQFVEMLVTLETY